MVSVLKGAAMRMETEMEVKANYKRGEISMNMIKKNTLKSTQWLAKVSRILTFTMLLSAFMYQGWYGPNEAQAAISQQQAWTNVYHAQAFPGATAASFAVSAGSNRMLVVAITSNYNAATVQTMTGVTYGGVAMTLAIGNAATSSRAHSYIFYLKDNAVMDGTAKTLAVTTSGGTPTVNDIYYAVFAGVDQSATPLTDSKIVTVTTAATTAAWATALTVGATDYAVEIINSQASFGTTARTITYATNWTMQTQQTWATTNGVRTAVANYGASGTNTTSSTTFSGNSYTSMAGVSMKAVSDVTPPTTSNLQFTSTVSGIYVGSPFSFTGSLTDNETAVSSCQYCVKNGVECTSGDTWVAGAVSGSTPTWTCTASNVTTYSNGGAITSGDSVYIDVRGTSGGGQNVDGGTAISKTMDKIAPTTTDDYPGGTVTDDPIITLTPTDAASGVLNTKYCVDQVNTCTPSTVGTSTTIVGTPAELSTWYLRYFSTDNVNNAETTKSTTVTINHTCVATAPTALTAGAVTTAQVPLSWTAGTNTDYYNVYRNGVKISTDGAVTGTSFTDTGRSPSVTYSYYVKGHNTANNCDSAASNTINKSTLAATPVAPTVVNVNATSVNVTIGSDGNSTEATYAIRANNGSLYVQADGTLNTTVVWQTKAAWGTKTVTGLSAIPYTFDVKARNGNGELVETVFGPDSSPAVTPHAMLPTTIEAAGGCGACHGNPPADGTARNTPVGQFRGSHNKHAATYSFACTKCHIDNGTNYAHRNGNIQTRSSINGDAGAKYDNKTSWEQTNSPAFGKCSNNYCHSKGTAVATGGFTNSTSPTWAGTADCETCHGNEVIDGEGRPAYDNNTPKKNSHVEHQFNCSTCHAKTTSDGVTITTVANHANKMYNLSSATAKFTTYSFPDSSPNAGGTCKNVVCHGGATGQWGVSTFDCTICHANSIAKTLGTPPAQTIRAVMADFVRLSRHISNGSATNIATKWDCIVCHMEGQQAVGATQGKTNPTYHNDANGFVNLRNVDSPTTGWQINNKSYTETMRNDQDTFCMTCHDSDGAAGINVNGTTGLNLNNSRQYTPFNTSDNLRNGRDLFTTRTRVIDVKGQFFAGTGGKSSNYNGNPSQHAVIQARYSTNNASWTAVTWTTHTLKNGTVMNVVREKAKLHCSDCHLSEVNAHGAANAWHMLQNRVAGDSTTDFAMTGAAFTSNAIVCWKCHNSAVYDPNVASTATRLSHDTDGDWGSGTYGTGAGESAKLGPACLLCHAGNGFGRIHGRGSATDGDSVTYTPVGATGTYSKYRFMPGAEMEWKPGTGGTDADWNSTTQGSCYFGAASTTWSTCTQHDGSNRTGNAVNYARPVKY